MQPIRTDIGHNPRVLQLNSRDQLRAELLNVGAEPSEVEEKIARGTYCILKLQDVSLTLARLLYQELVMEGGQVVTAARLEHSGEGTTAVLLCGTRYQFEHLLVRLRWQESDELDLLAAEINAALDHSANPPRPFEIGVTNFVWGSRTYIMGILNLTPDSFSGDGLMREGDSEAEFIKRVVARAQELIADGADILDIGGESTRPGAQPLEPQVELDRVLPVLHALRDTMNSPLSIDTRHANVAEAALTAGANLVNDVTSLSDSQMIQVIAHHSAPAVIMHNRLMPERRPLEHEDFIGEMLADLRKQLERAMDGGLNADRILIDPGLGFGKSVRQNLEIINRLGEFRSLGCPVLIGPSRKGFISQAISVSSAERLEGTTAAVALGITRGADMIRVHDVQAIARVAKMTDEITKNRTHFKNGSRL